ncbi:transporter [Marinoscillum sp.]|uniref:transporter n=1 Tax=Marinoscillum sp. TaxID=2024838 RepID=UPI003BA939FE
MSDAEFDVLDQLYFVTQMKQIQEETSISSSELIPVLERLHQKGWIKIMETVDEEVSEKEIDLKNRAQQYFYLATKEGLLAHNS